jgi:hypothetical protein
LSYIDDSINYLTSKGVRGSVASKAAGPCAICGVLDSVMNSHHTVPQSCGGQDSLQVSLCATHHDVLHAHALAILSAAKNNKKLKKQFWKTEREETNAAPLLTVLIRALEANRSGLLSNQRNLVSTDITSEQKMWLKSLAKDLRLNQTDALKFCLIYTLSSKGILSDEQYKQTIREIKKNT